MVTGHVSPLPPPNRTCDVHRLRLSGDWRLPAYAVIGSSFIDAAQFTSATRTSPRDLRRIGRRTSSPWPPAPWGRRSRPRTTMGPPTRWYVIGGRLPFAALPEPPTFTSTDSSRPLRWGFSITPTAPCGSRAETGEVRCTRFILDGREGVIHDRGAEMDTSHRCHARSHRAGSGDRGRLARRLKT